MNSLCSCYGLISGGCGLEEKILVYALYFLNHMIEFGFSMVTIP